MEYNKPEVDQFWVEVKVVIHVTNAVMKSFLKLFGRQVKHVLSTFCCDYMTKDDLIKSVEELFSSKRVA